MAALENDIKRVQDKLQQLLRQYQLLQRENEKLTESVKKLKDEKENQVQQVEQLQQQVSILKIAAGQMNETDKKSFEKNINQYIKDIDKCIALLSE
jgi:predicted nuclease with TOPRIM domain